MCLRRRGQRGEGRGQKETCGRSSESEREEGRKRWAEKAVRARGKRAERDGRKKQ